MPLHLLNRLSQHLIHVWKQRVGPRLSSLISVVTVGGLGVAIIALWGFAEITDEVLDQETQAFDQSILVALHSLHNPFLNQTMIGITSVGDPLVLTVLVAVFALFLALRQRWSEIVLVAIAAGGAIGLNFLLKDLFARARPSLWEHIVDVQYYSFPSGHAMMSLVVYGLLGYWLAIRFRGWQLLIVSITILLILAIGVSRLYLGVHWPTDVIAGYAAGLVWLSTCILVLEIIWKRRAKRMAQG